MIAIAMVLAAALSPLSDNPEVQVVKTFTNWQVLGKTNAQTQKKQCLAVNLTSSNFVLEAPDKLGFSMAEQGGLLGFEEQDDDAPPSKINLDGTTDSYEFPQSVSDLIKTGGIKRVRLKVSTLTKEVKEYDIDLSEAKNVFDIFGGPFCN
ncbi:MAG: hypothetical protein WA840_12515 [Caulobacteraceae bacterium]